MVIHGNALDATQCCTKAAVHSILFILTISSVMWPTHRPHLPHDHTCEGEEVLRWSSLSSLPHALSARRKILLNVANRTEVDQVVVVPRQLAESIQSYWERSHLHEGGAKTPVKIGPPGPILMRAKKFYDTGTRLQSFNALVLEISLESPSILSSAYSSLDSRLLTTSVKVSTSHCN